MIRLFFGNVDYRAIEQDLVEHFAIAGVRLSAVKILREARTGKSRGFGFAEVNCSHLDKALALNEITFLNRKLRVVEAIERR